MTRRHVSSTAGQQVQCPSCGTIWAPPAEGGALPLAEALEAEPAGAYGLGGPVGTIGVGNYLLARADVPEPAVRELLQVVFARWRDLLRDVTAGARLEPRFAISTGGVPLHPGAVDYYRSAYG